MLFALKVACGKRTKKYEKCLKCASINLKRTLLDGRARADAKPEHFGRDVAQHCSSCHKRFVREVKKIPT